MRKLGYMINHNEIELNQFFTMHPFSTSKRKVYNSALNGIDFLKELYIKNNKTYERLATVCNVINNTERNLVVITGYRGCGKTNFLKLIQYISDGAKDLETLKKLKEDDLKYAMDIEDIKKLILKEYEDSINKIRNIFFGHMYGLDNDIIGESLIRYISTQLSGKCKYINFDESGMGREKPFSTKLLYTVRASISKHEKEGRLLEILKLVDGFSKRNRWIIEENFEEIEFRTLKIFWKNAREKLIGLTGDDLYDGLLDEMKKLSLEQLLFAYTIWEYAEIISSKKEKEKRKLIYLLDNIDIISDGKSDIFKNTMMGVWKFVWDTGNVFDKIRDIQRKEDNYFVELYDKTNIIVAMRETTAMHISGHLRDKMREIMDHFDMSADVDKTMVMKRKIDLAIHMIDNGEIISKRFIEAIKCLNQLIDDRLFMRNLFLLFNNDYRTAMMCITTICIEHMDDIKKAIYLMESDNTSFVFGGRGIIYRLIINGFFEWDYFDAIGIPSSNSKGHNILLQSDHGFSCARVILTILCNKQAKRPERFFINPEESVRLADLYGMVQKLMSLDEFVNIIDGMYSLRNKRFWNHLVTFDNIMSYSPDVIKNYVSLDGVQTEETDIYIRATSAGQMFASVICIHFEYFASRYASASNNVSLFLIDNLTDQKQRASLKRIVRGVYGIVKKCINTLKVYNKCVMEIKDANHYDDILDSPYYYERQFHEERIIHNHISYLEAYRNFVFDLFLSDKILLDINEFLLSMMQKYLELLKYDRNKGYNKHRGLFFSINSEMLYNELSVCIEKIKENQELKNGITVTREYYRKNYDGQKCVFMLDLGDSDE